MIIPETTIIGAKKIICRCVFNLFLFRGNIAAISLLWDFLELMYLTVYIAVMHTIQINVKIMYHFIVLFFLKRHLVTLEFRKIQRIVLYLLHRWLCWLLLFSCQFYSLWLGAKIFNTVNKYVICSPLYTILLEWLHPLHT